MRSMNTSLSLLRRLRFSIRYCVKGREEERDSAKERKFDICILYLTKSHVVDKRNKAVLYNHNV